MKKFFKKLKNGVCKFCGEIAEPVMIMGSHYYNTAPCRCKEGSASTVKWLETMDANWTPPPKTETELLTESVQQLTEALYRNAYRLNKLEQESKIQ